MNNMMNRKEEKLHGRFRDTHTALQWLRDNRQLFKGNVHEPMMLVVSPTQRPTSVTEIVSRIKTNVKYVILEAVTVENGHALIFVAI